MEATHQSTLIADADADRHPVVFANAAFTKLTGYAADEVVGKNCGFLAGCDTDADVRTEMRDAIAAFRPFDGVLLNYRKDGSRFWNHVQLVLLDDSTHGRFWMGTQTDVTERRALETRLHDAERMEVTGKLCGGIAHDFNNILAIVRGNAEVIAANARCGSAMKGAAADIIDAADGGAKLVTRLLRFARGEQGGSDDVPLNTAIADVVALLARTIGKRVHIETDLSSGVGRVRMDRTLFETALMNLILNARDATAGGGTIRITTEQCVDTGFRPGASAIVSVSDNGTGMDEATAARAFECFFTTKGNGRGHGLGLAMVQDFARQSHGHVSIETALGHGATVKLVLPMDAPLPR